MREDLTLDEACVVEYGTRVVRKNDAGSIYPVYGGGGETFFVDAFNRTDRTVISRFGMSPRCVRHVAGRFFLNDSGLTISPRRPEILLQRYLDWWAHYRTPAIYASGRGSAQKNLNLDLFRALTVPVPDVPDQKRIVAVLDKAFEAVARATAKSERALKCASELEHSIVDAKLHDVSRNSPEVQLDTLRDQRRVITYGVIKLGDQVDDGVPCLRTSNVRWLGIELDGMKRIRPELSDEYRRTILQGGEVLVNVRGTLGGVAIAGPEMRGWNISREVAMVPTDAKRADPTYLAYWIARTKSQNWLTGVLTGATYTGINIADLRTLPVSLPSLEDQRRIALEIDDALDSARSLKQHYERKLQELTALKQSLLHHAFTGQLTSADNIAA